MLKDLDLSRKVPKPDFKKQAEQLSLKLGALQRQALEQRVPWIVVFEGWNAAGKGTLINDLIQPLDPRGFAVLSSHNNPNEEEAYRPFLWRFWERTPARGRLTIFDRSWYFRVMEDRIEKRITPHAAELACRDIQAFERQLCDDGTVIIKFFLHISKAEQQERFDALRRDKVTAWRVTREDLARHRQYKAYRKIVEDTLADTESEFAPWTVVEAHDRRFAALKIFSTVIAALEERLNRAPARPAPRAKPAPKRRALPESLAPSLIDRLDLKQTLAPEVYEARMEQLQERMRYLEHEIYRRRVPVVIAYEGCDAAGKGGNIRRLTQKLDPRGYEVVPIAAPNDIERAHHYLWRFWTRMPKAGHITIFDRSWYGRVLVERVEGFCAEDDWRRAYREINELEQHLINYGTVLLKFWLQIDPREQLRRFRLRERTEHKRWKITEEDWRNRAKWPAYKEAVEEMLVRTSPPNAPWTIVESNCKYFARVKVLETVTRAIERRLKLKA